MERKLYRSTDGQMIAGVCAGLGKYFNVDPTLVRVLFAILALFGGGGVLLYFILMLIIPMEPTATGFTVTEPFKTTPAESTFTAPEAPVQPTEPAKDEPIDPGL